MKALAFLSSAVLIAACFFPWLNIESKHIIISGVNTTGTTFGKPGVLHFFLTGLTVLCLLINKDWAQKAAVVFSAFNIAWAIRNFAFLSACQMGDCPVKLTALYFLIPSSILLLIGTLFSRTVATPVD
ncbi:MAG: hypothetical protein ACM3VS_11445 [Candidatus Dadabacteria bacterium]